jgi:hypothetical protein
MRQLLRSWPILGLLYLLSNGCADDVLPGSGSLTFSRDTVIFDTVFTTIGSVTRQFKVYNPQRDEVTISSIVLMGGQQSKYRLNVNGDPGSSFSNVKIRGGDSIFVFVDVTLDPNNQNDPIMVMDSIRFVTDGAEQFVHLAACGWDAIFQYPTQVIQPFGPVSIIDCNVVWTSAKPIVLYGYAVVDEGCRLDIEAGTRIYSHKNSGLLVFDGGVLSVNGQLESEVVFASDRLDEFYRDQAGEWAGLWLFRGSETTIDHALIKNANVGILMGPLTEEQYDKPKLIIRNTVLENMAGAGLLAYNGSVRAFNTVFGNSGQVSAGLTTGGDYEFRHCTFGNHWFLGNRQTPALLVSNWFDVPGMPFFEPLDAYFGNCIISGNNLNELRLDEHPSTAFEFKMERCLLRVKPEDVDVSDTQRFVDIILNQSPNFKMPIEHDFQLDTLSPAKDAGYMSITNFDPGVLSTDILGNFRPAPGSSGPDLGAYERQEN